MDNRTSATEASKESEPPGGNLIKHSPKILGLSKKGSFFVAKNRPNTRRYLDISYKINRNNFKIKVLDDVYTVKYANGVLKRLDDQTKEILVSNFLYNRTLPLSLVQKKALSYQSSQPFLKPLIEYGAKKDISRLSELIKVKSKKLFQNLAAAQKQKVIFTKSNLPLTILPAQKTSLTTAILSLSFGKDSLLTYGLAKEIGLKTYLAFINDMEKYNLHELKIKKKIIKEFCKNQNEEVFLINDDTDNLFRNKKLKGQFDELDGTNGMLSFVLELIPLAFNRRAKYIIFGNERNLDDYFVNQENLKVYPSGDQSLPYMKEQNKYLHTLTNGHLQVISLVKPLYNLAEVKILYRRYPHLLKFLMSCSSENLTNGRWCYQCTTCAWAFLYATAFGNNPKEIGINTNLFEKKYLQFFSLFNPKIEKIYERPPQIREEQLLGFLLAYRNGFKGHLMNLFEHRFLKEAEKKEASLRKKFFGIHSTEILPKEFKDKVLKIFREELKGLS